MHIQTRYTFVDLQKLCSFAGPGIQTPVVANAVNPALPNVSGDSSAILACRYAPMDIVDHGRLHLGTGGARDADLVWIPLKVWWLKMKAQSILSTTT